MKLKNEMNQKYNNRNKLVVKTNNTLNHNKIRNILD